MGRSPKAGNSPASEYVLELILAYEKRKAEDVLDTKLLKGLKSPKTELMAAVWKEIRAEALAKVTARKKPH